MHVASYKTVSRGRATPEVSCYTGTGHDGARGSGIVRGMLYMHAQTDS